MGHDVRSPRGPRCIALVGPFQSGKTTLLEAILARTGAIPKAGTVEGGTTFGDASPEARAHRMSVSLTAATVSFMGDSYTFIDCPGSVEFIHDMRAALPAVDAAVVVCEADERKLPQLQIIMRELEDLGIPRFLFLNKIDKADARVRDTLATLQPASRVPLVLRQIPIWADNIVTGFVDLALERAFVYREHLPSEVISLDGGDLDREKEARFTMLEKLADHDDRLMEQLLEDIPPPRDAVFDDLARELREGQICPVLLGSAVRENGVLRLMKALRHECPGVEATAERLGVKASGKDAVAYVLKTAHLQHGGKLSLSRVLAGRLDDGATLLSSRGEAARISGMSAASAATDTKRTSAETGDVVALGKLDAVRTGDTLSSGKTAPKALIEIAPLSPVLAIALAAVDRKDDVKLGQALARLNDEDPSLTMIHDPISHEIVVWGQGEMHLRVALERLRDRFGVTVKQHAPAVGYQETIRKPMTQRGRHKKQSGGHGQFGDVVLDIKPLPRGGGFAFTEKIVGGAVPRNYIPAVEDGVKDGLLRGPLGFPVIDVAVTLTDGSYHSVDSSDLAFRTAARTGMNEALPQCQPVLLEPIYEVEIVCPTDATAKINAILSGRRGQILSFDTRENWSGWDAVKALMPEAEIGDLIVELRSATAGAGGFSRRFDHMAEVTGRAAEQIIAAHRSAAA
ncbi:elongation factor G [Bradyrhizobium sp. U87765 SZCCT0131]|uniref:elongation factor G n=1 Tax=unclassified Bradyrhizobium TaxID=2631580 RepID=UPI001BAD0EAB|nr:MULTISPECIES: elongation factor G [unclassified Bradyrhizobium]MBR1221890.1 elongation factor G [Bradyrhizobium sp. U87765 SZCCT0131]MBR1263912.1 elongation factor G [Bradyrhizobium sp. U87765 SZCCT0134]MBR1302518.1 elongation factor G [Bradyrhizobium sp. U87765 SZCCT0110]MBR1320162.1 elongation factor G [Bradyrhizobium sp. U87765 SZCCT0109]MBR1348725.1 elongation factor G [Bradyrhizobium sp. U87765 SZCCT0048]